MTKPLERLLGSDVIRQIGDTRERVPVTSFTEPGSVVGLYFSASWCPPCKSFTPRLKEFYVNKRKEGCSFEIIFISWDKDENGYNEYVSTMPWLAVPFGADKRKKVK